MDVLKEKVENIREDVVELKGDRDDHERRITSLEVSESTIMAKMENLVDSVKSLTSVLKWGFALAFGSLLSFFIWFIQQKGV